MSQAREAETVDHRLVGGEAKQARTRVALLRQRRDRAYLGKAETKTKDLTGDVPILVEPRRESERIWKVETEGFDGEARIIGSGWWQRDSAKRLDCPLMRGLWIETEQQGPRERGVNAGH